MPKYGKPIPGDRDDREFEAAFEAGGWEKIQKMYGGRSLSHRSWKKMTGAKCRMPKRSKV